MRSVCPFCGGALPGKPGQYVNCCHCAQSIHWANNKPFRSLSDAQEHAQLLRAQRQEQAQREQIRKLQEAASARERQEKQRELERRRDEQWRRWKESRRVVEVERAAAVWNTFRHSAIVRFYSFLTTPGPLGLSMGFRLGSIGGIGMILVLGLGIKVNLGSAR
jgi:hypothetical protein